MDEIVQFDFPTDSPKIIKVIGVGGGGGNAVNHMYREGIHDVTFVLCNTDNQALAESPVPVKLQLGRSITQGLGAGNRPERARDAAEESIDEITAVQAVHYSIPGHGNRRTQQSAAYKMHALQYVPITLPQQE